MVVNGCESFDVSIGCAGMIGEGRKTWMHTYNIVGSWLLAQTTLGKKALCYNFMILVSVAHMMNYCDLKHKQHLHQTKHN